MNLDVKDQKILLELSLNGRQPSTQIARRVRLSREVVEYRIKRLIEQGIIKKFSALIDVDALGFESYNILLLLHDFTGERKKEAIEYLANHAAVRWLVVCSGRWDIFFRISVKNEEEFRRVFGEIRNKIGKNLISFEVIKSVGRLKMVSPVELFQKKVPDNPLPKRLTLIKLTKLDLIILKEMSNKARISLIELSKLVGLTPEAVKYRIKRLEAGGIINGYSCVIDLSRLGYAWYILLFSLNEMGKENENRLKTFLNTSNKIWFVDKNTGKWNLRVELVATGTRDFQDTLTELRKMIGADLLSFDLLLVFEEFVNERYSRYIDETLKTRLD